MAYITFKNMDEYEAKIVKLAKRSHGLCKQVVYSGAGVMADALKEALKGLPIEEGKNGLPPFAPPGEKINGVSKRQRQDLINSFGIAKIREKNGYIYAKLGVDGYGSVKTKQWSKGIPNIVLLRSIESGTSFRVKNPIIRQTVSRYKEKTKHRMAQKTDELIKKEF